MNCILLPSTHFSLPCAYIDNPSQIDHINKILAAKVGDTLKIGQLDGYLGTAVIDEIKPSRIQLRDVELSKAPPAKLDVTVILALPRPKVLRRLIMDMTAIGVRDIVLINSYRTQKSYWQSPLLARIDEFVLEGLQQGVDTIAPRIHLKKRFKPFVEDELQSFISNHAIVAHPYSDMSFIDYLHQLATDQDSHDLNIINQPTKSVSPILPSVICIGAEGGWIDYEIVLLAEQGCQAVTIGNRVLRTEAAVNVILGYWLLHH